MHQSWWEKETEDEWWRSKEFIKEGEARFVAGKRTLRGESLTSDTCILLCRTAVRFTQQDSFHSHGKLLPPIIFLFPISLLCHGSLTDRFRTSPYEVTFIENVNHVDLLTRYRTERLLIYYFFYLYIELLSEDQSIKICLWNDEI